MQKCHTKMCRGGRGLPDMSNGFCVSEFVVKYSKYMSLKEGSQSSLRVDERTNTHNMMQTLYRIKI